MTDEAKEVLMEPLEPQSAHEWSDTSLSEGVSLFLKRTGVISVETTTTNEQGRFIQGDESTQDTWLPLLPQSDVQALLSLVPAQLRPASLPWPVEEAASNAAAQQANQALDILARLALEPSLTFEVLRAFKPLAAHFCGRWLDMLGIDDQGRWDDSSPATPQLAQAVTKVLDAYSRIIAVFPEAFPCGLLLLPEPASGSHSPWNSYLATLLRHPCLAQPPMASTNDSIESITASLLTFLRLLYTMPHLPTSQHTSTSSRPPWSFPAQVETLMKAHPHRGVRALAWRVMRKWYGFFAQTGEQLREKWVWKDAGGDDCKRMPPLPVPTEFLQRIGLNASDDQAVESLEHDMLPNFDARLTGKARFVQGGVRLQVRTRAVDAWVVSSLERLRVRDLAAELAEHEAFPLSPAFLHVSSFQLALASSVVPISTTLVFREGFIPSAESKSTQQTLPSKDRATSEEVVPTRSADAALQSLAKAVGTRQPIVLASPASAGKATVLNELWSRLHARPNERQLTDAARKRGIVFINLADRSIDSKSLLGSLSSSPTDSAEAGTFSFVEGPLTRAVRQGRWLVLSSIEQASPEVLSVVKVLAERMHTSQHPSFGPGAAWGGGPSEANLGVGIRIPGGTSRWIPAGKGFMLFATRTSSEETPAKFFGHHFWRQVWLARPSADEVLEIVGGLFERVRRAALARTLVDAWSNVVSLNTRDGSTASSRPIGVRELMRWARRVDSVLAGSPPFASVQSNPTIQDELFLEARDVFLGSSPLPATTTADRFGSIVDILKTSLLLSEDRVESLLRRRTPEIAVPRAETATGRVDKSVQQLIIGRASLPCIPQPTRQAARPYALTKPSLSLLEKLAVCVKMSEPILMVGETGTGKTAAVGHLADMLGQKLTALNLSNQTEAADLVGGYRPIDESEEGRRVAGTLVNRFIDIFGRTVSLSRNAEYVDSVKKAFEKKRWSRLVALWRRASQIADERLKQTSQPSATAGDETPRKRRKVEQTLPELWQAFMDDVTAFEIRHVQKAGRSRFIFSFVEGPLAKAIRDGEWVLLDEVNLASSETLECLSALLQTPDSSIVLTEQGDLEPIPRHRDFRLFACMNPATDVGKRDLPATLRSKFSEIWVPPPDEDRDALVAIVQGYIGHRATQDRGVILDVAELYSAVKGMAIRAELADGSNQPPHFSMRTLARALSFAADFAPSFGLRRSLYEGFIMAFTMLLDSNSIVLVKGLLEQHIVSRAKNRGSLFSHVPNAPTDYEAIRFGPYWLQVGGHAVEEPEDYILTPSVQAKVLDLARAVLMRKVPILIQGPTSAGKTSVVEYLAKRTGHRFVRINNHEHTDIQEYLGSYVSDSTTGKLVFQEGVLVRALRQGDWVVLDELNLAPTDVLEALNRLLDDNRELVIPETGEVVRPHPHFMLFATQNPPGLYGGRKVLSRAFRNRFLEMHFGDVPKDELETILSKRCQIAPSYAKKTVAVFVELQRRRQAGRVFEQKQAFATLRDLFRWGGRGSVGYQQLAEDGYMLLAERARRQDDKAVVKDVIETEMRVKIDDASLYSFDRLAELKIPAPANDSGLVWTRAMRRLYVLIAAALLRSEPVLLVGETGSGKTSVCMELARAFGRQVHIVGCHQNSESADLLGGQRPIRNRASIQAGLRKDVLEQFPMLAQQMSDTFDDLFDAAATLSNTLEGTDKLRLTDIVQRMKQATALFEWHDGPLVQAMRDGDFVLLDEISLADDSVLERLNSVLEPSRTLVLAEKGGTDLDDIRVVGQQGFEILATMNPGGDFGKKELSPALRNRFTEIWVPAVDTTDDLLEIISRRWSRDELSIYSDRILQFGKWLGSKLGLSDDQPGVSLRDILAWVSFINATTSDLNKRPLDARDAFCQGAMLVSVDGLGASAATSAWSRKAIASLRRDCCQVLRELSNADTSPDQVEIRPDADDQTFSIGQFSVAKGPHPDQASSFSLEAPTTCLNAYRVLRALQLARPVLLEGSPGVGKTSLITALAAATGHRLVRINLSDQTDLMDLFGSDLPVEGGKPGEFAWKDAAFLTAMQVGDWVLLDEMNLASQAVLEGLNSCLDHRGTVYIPELDRSFVRHANFRIFAAQNPLGQGGGRKGLPRSFLDRFSIVYMNELSETDLQAIAQSQYPCFEPSLLSSMIEYVVKLHRYSMEERRFGSEGSPWEFNLRDALRWLSLLANPSGLERYSQHPAEVVRTLFLQRFRNTSDRAFASRLFEEIFAHKLDYLSRPAVVATPTCVAVGHSIINRGDSQGLAASSIASLPFAQSHLETFEALTSTIDLGALAILVGPAGAGKTTLVRQIAVAAGKHLDEFTMNAEVDTLELLGSFEQADRARGWLDAVNQIEQQVRSEIYARSLDEIDAASLHTSLLSLASIRTSLTTESVTDQQIDSAEQALLSVVESLERDATASARAFVIQARRRSSNTSARFEWVDGPLVRAMKSGSWLVLEDANLCSASVLDRLNSLFENNGKLQLVERGPINGEIETVQAHPDFRMIMTLDPQHGELSRAMRNRGIEIALLRDEVSSPVSADLLEDADQGLHLVCNSFGATEPDMTQSALSASRPQSIALARLLRQTGDSSQALTFASLEKAPLFGIADHEKARLRASSPASNRIIVEEIGRNEPREILLAINLPNASRAVSLANETVASIISTSSLDASKLASARNIDASFRSLWQRASLQGLVRASEDDEDLRLALGIRDVVHSGREAALDVLTTSTLDHSHVVSKLLDLLRAFEWSLQSRVADFATLQQTIAWTRELLEQPSIATIAPLDALRQAVGQLDTRLRLTSGLAMMAIWTACLPLTTNLSSSHRQLCNVGASRRVLGSDMLRVLLDTARATGGNGSHDAPSKAMDELVQDLVKTIEHAPTFLPESTVTADYADSLQLVSTLSILANKSSDQRSELSMIGSLASTPLRDLVTYDTATSGSHRTIASLLSAFATWTANSDSFFMSTLPLAPQLAALDLLPDSAQASLGDLYRHRDLVRKSAFLQAVTLEVARASPLVYMASLLDEFESLLIQQVHDAQITSADDRRAVSVAVATYQQLKQDSPRETGIHLLTMGQLLWHLFVPNVPVDPVISRNARRTFLEQCQNRLRRLSELFHESEELLTGNSGNSKTTMLEERFNAISLSNALQLVALTNNRPAQPELVAALFRELSTFERQVLTAHRIDALVKQLSGSSAQVEQLVDNVIQSIESLSRRLDTIYATIPDITIIARFALDLVRLGLSVLLGQRRSRPTSSSGEAVDPLQLFKFPSTGGPLHDLADKQILAVEGGPGLAEIAQLQIQAAALSYHTTGGSSDVSALVSAFDRFQALWQQDLHLEEKRAAEAESLYRSRTETFEQKSEDEEAAAELAALFPTYESEQGELPVASTTNVSHSSAKSHLLQANLVDVAKVHLALFGRHRSSGSDLHQTFIDTRHEFATKFLKAKAYAFSDEADSVTDVYRLRSLVESARRLEEQQPSDVMPDFYTEPNVAETSKAISILDHGVSRLDALIAHFPDQMVLQALRDRCQAILAFSSQSPVMKVLTALEQLLTQTEDWETFASREHSLASIRGLLTSQIVEWRRLELSCWAAILDRVSSTFHEAALAFWPRLYGATLACIRRGEDEDDVHEEANQQLATLVETFLADCSAGQFDARLQLVDAFADLTAVLAGRSDYVDVDGAQSVSRILSNAASLFSQYSASVSKYVSSQRAALDKEVKSIIKLASWKDVNVYALRQSAVKSHHQLYKSMRKLREILQKPASDFFHGSDLSQKAQGFCLVLPSSDFVATLPELIRSGAPEHLNSLSRTLARLSNVTRETLPSSSGSKEAARLDAFAVEIIETAQDLRSEASSKGDDQAQRIKSLASRKRRAWADLLRELKRIGASPTPSPDAIRHLHDSAAVLSRAKPVSDLQDVVRANEYHYLLLRELPGLLRLPAQHHDDISSREVQRALGSIQSCLWTSLLARDHISNLLNSSKRLQAAAHVVAAAASAPAPQAVQQLHRMKERLNAIASTVTAALSEVSQALEDHKYARQGQSDSATEALRQHVATYRIQLDQSAAVEAFPISTRDALEETVALSNSLLRFKKETARLDDSRPLDYFIQPFKAFSAALDVPLVERFTSSASASELSSAERLHDVVINSILVVVQSLSALPHNDSNDDSKMGDAEFKHAFAHHRTVWSTLKVDEVYEHLFAFAAAIAPHLDHASQANDLLSRVAPFVSLYCQLVSSHVEAFAYWYKTTLKLAYILVSVLKDLCANGFCKPSDADDDGEAGDQGAEGDTVSGGTGMAAGKGETNVSKEIEDESQVEGLEGEEETERNPEDDQQDGDDDAVEMGPDFDGELEDRGDGADKEEGDEEDEDEKEEPDVDEEVADVDPLDPSTVDEKFWGDEEEKNRDQQDDKQDRVNQEIEQQGESEMKAKEDGASKDAQKKDDDEAAPADQESADEPDEDTAADDDAQAEADDAGAEDADAPEHKDRDKLDEQMPEADNLDLPEDMQLDGDDQKAPEDDLDDDLGSLPEDPDAMSEDDFDKRDGSMTPEEHDEDANKDEDAGDDQPEASADDEQTVEPADETIGGQDAGQTGGEGADDAGADAQMDEGRSAEETAGGPGSQERESQPQPRPAEASQARDNDEADADQVDESNADIGAGSGPSRPADQATNDSKDGGPDSLPQPQQRSLAQQIESWRRRLEQISEPTNEPQDEQGERPTEQEGAPDLSKAEVEYVPEGQEQEADEAALGPANDEQIKAIERLQLDDEQVAHDEPEQMQIDHSEGVEAAPQPTNVVNLDSSAVPEGDSKAVSAAELQSRQTAIDTAQEDQPAHTRDDHVVRPLAPSRVDPVENEKVEQALLKWRKDEDGMTSDGVWRLYESLTRDLAYSLTEQLRLILEPTLATRLRGDYRSGKRLNMKKIIPYIASEFTKDKIWLRRTRPSQREYQVMIAIDDSKSMADSHSVHLAFQSLTLITRALTRLEVGAVAVGRFGESLDILHDFDAGNIGSEQGVKLLEGFTFAQQTTDVRLLVEQSLARLSRAKESSQSGKSSAAAEELWQLEIIISDGMCQDHDKLRSLLRQAKEQKVMFVFVIIDSLHRRAAAAASSSATPAAAQAKDDNSILAMKSVSYAKGANGQMELKVDRYLDTFPFEYFIVLRDVEALPEVLSSTLRQFFESVSSSDR